ncbi:hypothetical protein EAH79_16770 [Sphingomonas koreensis]|nr:hypothetical protein EAH79_16770 [Sphingomonas koreensis]
MEQQPGLSRRAVLSSGIAATAGAIANPAGALASGDQTGALRSIEAMSGGLLITFEARRVFVCIATSGVASVVSYPIGEPAPPFGPFVPATRPASETATDAAVTRLIGPGIVVEADRRTGQLSFAHPQQGVRIAETSAAAPIAGVPIARVQSFAVDPATRCTGSANSANPTLKGHTPTCRAVCGSTSFFTMASVMRSDGV